MAKRLTSIFFGTPAFAISSFEAAYRETRLLAAVTQPDRPRGRGQKLSPCEIKTAALAKNIPVFDPASLRKPSEMLDSLLAFLKTNPPDLFIVTAYGNLLPQSFLDIPSRGPINVHASLLPRWRGAAPIQRCLEAGDAETGVCLQKMVMALDAGDVLAESRQTLSEHVSSDDLFTELAVSGGTLLGNYLSKLGDNPLVGNAQNPALITLAPKISKEEGFWSPEWSARETQRKARAFHPWPSVKARLLEGPEFKIIRSSLGEGSPEFSPQSPGTLMIRGNRCYLACTVRPGEPTWLSLETVQLSGKPPAQAADVFRNFIPADSRAGQGLLQVVKIQQ